jgi:hypothetical protein
MRQLFFLALLSALLGASHAQGLSKADIAEAVAEGFGTAVDSVAARMSTLLASLPTTPPPEEPEAKISFFEVLDNFAVKEIEPAFIDNPPLGPLQGPLDAEVMGPGGAPKPRLPPHHGPRSHLRRRPA